MPDTRARLTDDVLRRDVFTTGQAAALIGVGAQSVRRACQTGGIEGFEIPGPQARHHWRIPRAALVRWLRANGVDHALRLLGES